MENVNRFEEDSSCLSLSELHADSDLGRCDSTIQISKTSARTRNSNSTSDDNDIEKKEKRRKQKRDYAARRREQNKHQLDSLELANRKLGRRSKRQRQQIEQLKTWAMYARSYLSLCCQLLAYRPAAQQSPHVLLPAGPAPGPAFHTPVAPEAETASSSSPSSSLSLSSYYSFASSPSLLDESEALETSASAVTVNTRTTGRDLDQPPDPDWDRECSSQTVSMGVEGNLFAQDPTITGTSMGLDDRELVLLLSNCCPRGPLPLSGIEETVAEADADADADADDDVGFNVLSCEADILGTTEEALEWESIARNPENSGVWDQIPKLISQS